MSDFAQNTFKCITDIWLEPALKARKMTGYKTAQLIFIQPSGEVKVRFNSEVHCSLKLNLKEELRGTKKVGESILWSEVESIADAQTDLPNAGHITIINTDFGRFLCFDFRYNKESAKKLLGKAKQFLEMAKYGLEKQYPTADDLLFSAAELAIKADGLMLYLAHKSKIEHKDIELHAQKMKRDEAINKNFIDAFNKLRELRVPARYKDEDSFDLIRSKEIIKHIENAIIKTEFKLGDIGEKSVTNIG